VQAGEVRRAGGMAGDGGLDQERSRGEGGEGDELQGEGGAVAAVAATEPEDDGGKEAEGDGHREIGGEERGGDLAGALAGEDPEKVAGHAEGEKPEDGGPRADQEGVEGDHAKPTAVLTGLTKFFREGSRKHWMRLITPFTLKRGNTHKHE